MTFSNIDEQEDNTKTIISSSFFILKDEESLFELNSIIGLFENKEDFVLTKHSTELLAYKLVIKTNCMFFPEIPNVGDSTSIWKKIQSFLAKDSWFFVDEVNISKSSIDSTIEFYHQDGRMSVVSTFESKKNILNKMGI